MQGRPMVSVIVPVYNGEEYLAEALESVLAQDYHPTEIIVVDDGSTDGTAQVASRLKDSIRYIYQPNSGPAAARNRGLSAAGGEVIGFLDADDMWVGDKLELQTGRLAGDSSAQVVIGSVQNVEDLKTVGGELRFEKLSEPMVPLMLGSALFRRAVFDKVGLFDETLTFCEDWDWFMRARELAVPMVIHHDVVLLHRRHEGNMTNQREEINPFVLKMLKMSLDRRKQGSMPPAPLPGLSDLKERHGDKV